MISLEMCHIWQNATRKCNISDFTMHELFHSQEFHGVLQERQTMHFTSHSQILNATFIC